AQGVTTAYLNLHSDHVVTHCDAVKHIRGPEAPGPEGIPLEYCYSDGVVLDFRHKPYGSRISVADIAESLAKINYTLKERDILLIQTGASAYNTAQPYVTYPGGLTSVATR